MFGVAAISAINAVAAEKADREAFEASLEGLPEGEAQRRREHRETIRALNRMAAAKERAARASEENGPSPAMAFGLGVVLGAVIG